MQSGPRPSARTLAVLDCFLVLGLLGIYLKIGMLDQHWESIARFLGKLKDYEVGPLQRLGFYYADIAQNLVLIPLAGTLLVSAVFRRWRVAAAVIVCALISVLYFFELRAQGEVGQYVSRDLLMDSLRWVIANPGASGEYLTPASMVKFGLLLFVLLAIGFIARRHRLAEKRTRRKDARRWRGLLLAPAVIAMLGAIGFAALGYAKRSDSSLNASAVGRIAHALIAPAADGSLARLDFDQALAASKTLTRTPALDAASPLIGSERDADVLVFIMETGPAQAFDFAANARELPGAGALLDHAFVGARHYTSYPYTSDAVFSILSGLYPEGRRRLFRRTGNAPLNGLMTALAPRMPMRRIYLPSLYHAEVDDAMYAAFGAETLYSADERRDDPLRATGESRADALLADLEKGGSTFSAPDRTLLRARLAADLQALERMKADIADAVHAGKRYCIAYLPQVAHGPWIALHDETSVLARGRALMILQDLWVKELVDLLRDLGRLDHTVIALTADHGIRTRAEDPGLAIGKISDYMFRVPLLLYAPNALGETRALDVPTSHIDLAPTLLALLGETAPLARMQGIPIWQRSAQDRLYFWAAAYGGADGFEQDGTYYMRQALSGSAFKSPRFEFTDASVLAPGDPANAFVDGTLDEANRLQQTIVTQWAPKPQ